ncbi:rhomboid family intramembrane serine protease [Anaeromyxobacter paludicola]|uniref:Rhomboid family intramembrane serine protease n=1 Tax=Anaeromyxobacter paludicola TaxID=2918171 RepID=A0ABM7X9C1_9BACT|nr:rhomboid family intramembrane serine protease [Anaeromyxobacter paludicola]BDG08410.1 rhomboid family intramembrane serine protease [Anaeromyxobacter paludicola]
MIPLKDDIALGRTPPLTTALIAVNVLAFGWQALVAGLSLSTQTGGAIPYEILTFVDVPPQDLVPPPFTILTSMFLHGGLGHIAGNMLFLWVFGRAVELALGPGRFLAFYLASGVAAALSQTVVSAFAGDVLTPMVGASGAIAGVLAAYLVLFPRARVLTLVPIFFFIRLMYLPAFFFIGAWFVLQLLSAAWGGGGSGIAFMAHVGGFLSGLALVRLLRRRPRWHAPSAW